MLVSLLLILVFLAFVVLMYLKKISAMLALPAMALVFAVVTDLPTDYILKNMLEEGPQRFGSAIMAAIFGSMLALFIRNQGIAEALARYAAELGGERPRLLGLSMMFVTALLFFLLHGLGAVIMVGSIVLPLMMSVGIPPLTAATIMILGLSMGGTLNLVNWQLYVSVLGLPKATVRDFMIIIFALYVVVGTAYCWWSLRPSQLHRFWSEAAPRATMPLRRLALLAPVSPLLCVLILHWPIVPSFVAGLLFTLLVSTQPGQRALLSLLVLMANVWAISAFMPHLTALHVGEELAIWQAAVYGLLALLPFLAWTILALWRTQRRREEGRFTLAVLVPLVPLLLIHFLGLDSISAFLSGFLLAIVLTIRRETVQVFTKSTLDAFESAAPAVLLIIGIGILLTAVSHENVRVALDPIIAMLRPQSPITFVLMFGLLAPLALYRGPLNIWGMGSGLSAILLATGALRPEVIMAVLASVSAVQAVCDPTNTHSVWIASQTKVETLDILRRTLPFIWPMSIVALTIAAVLYY
ncbi:MAG: SLC13 family permease [bacterium]